MPGAAVVCRDESALGPFDSIDEGGPRPARPGVPVVVKPLVFDTGPHVHGHHHHAPDAAARAPQP